MKIVVHSRYHPDSLSFSVEEDDVVPMLSDEDERNDKLDLYNHPRFRRAIILREFSRRSNKTNGAATTTAIEFYVPSVKSPDMNLYKSVQNDGLIDFFMTAWNRWAALGEGGRDPISSLEFAEGNDNSNNKGDDHNDNDTPTPALVPGNTVLHRVSFQQRPSKNVMGQIGYYCTDTVTAVFGELKEELLWDSAVVQAAVDTAADNASTPALAYALVTHPGHHASKDAFGGYCYLNHAACAAKLFQTTKNCSKIAVLDVDYHVGNGTAAIFYEDPTVLVISIHCNPDYDYPFHSGFEDEVGAGPGIGATLHLPLAPKTTWKEYSVALELAMKKIQSFGAEALVLSLGLDTHDGDPCAIRRAGFKLSGTDYLEMGKTIGKMQIRKVDNTVIPTVVIQEGGYRMEKVPAAAADVLCGYAEACTASS